MGFGIFKSDSSPERWALKMSELFIILAFSIYGFMMSLSSPVAWIFIMVVTMIGFGGLFVVNPNEARVLQFFGSYVGTVKEPGLRWTNPFYTKRTVSLRIRNFESPKLKWNDHDGNPI